jgi:hypothetical protein
LSRQPASATTARNAGEQILTIILRRITDLTEAGVGSGRVALESRLSLTGFGVDS